MGKGFMSDNATQLTYKSRDQESLLFDNSSTHTGRLISKHELAQWLGVPVRTIESWVYRRAIQSYKIGRSVRFSVRQVEQWIESRRLNHVDPDN